MKPWLLFPAVLLAGCATTKSALEDHDPIAANGAFAGASGSIATSAPPPADWWRLFDSPELDAHVLRALEANRDLDVALAHLETARSAERQAQAQRLPATMVESGAGPTTAADQPSTSSVPKTSYELGATVAYELDLFGRLRSTARAAQADTAATQAAYDAARVAVAADTTAAYVDLCGAVAALAIAESQLAAQRRNVQLIERQLAAGEVAPLDLSQAQTQLASTEASLPPLQSARTLALFRLATLEGLPPAEALSWTFECSAPPVISAPLPVGDGATLLARRPDIREAEQRLAAATARIDVATAELYPRISLGGSAGLIRGGFDAVLTPLISWAFPNTSAARARIAVAQGNEAAALATWDATILRALREVESTLAEYQAERLRNLQLRAAESSAQLSVRRMEARYRLGQESYLPVLVATRTRNDAASQRSSSDLRIAQLQVALFRALGGGWAAEAP